MEKTRNNCFRLKYRDLTLRKAKIGKQELTKITVMYKTEFDFDFEHGIGLGEPGTMSRNSLLVGT